jgi:hypothetical protein
MISNIVTWISDFNDMMAFPESLLVLSVFISSAIVFFNILRKYYSPLSRIFGRLGLSPAGRVRVLFRCISLRKTMNHFRTFVELAILRSQGEVQNKRFWKNLRQEFKDMIAANGNAISLGTCFELTHPKIGEIISEYFELISLSTGKKKPKSSPGNGQGDSSVQKGILRFQTLIDIRYGYLAPLALICGLEERFFSDWTKIICAYSSKSAILSGATKTLELYMLYAWIMWGPSISLHYSEDRYKLIQYGFGDENNSINLVLRNDPNSIRAWKRLVKENPRGYHCALRARLCDSATYLNSTNEDNEKNSGNFDASVLPLVARLSQVRLGMNFLLEYVSQGVEDERGKCQKARHPYYSAYLWIMFVQAGDKGEQPMRFCLDEALIFFEHPNLADDASYNYFADCLIQKSLSYFGRLAEMGDTRAFYLSFAVHEDIRVRFADGLCRRPDLSGRIKIDAYPLFSFEILFSAIDQYFASGDAEAYRGEYHRRGDSSDEHVPPVLSHG